MATLVLNIAIGQKHTPNATTPTSQSIYPFRSSATGMVGYIDSHGRIIISPHIDYCDWSSQGASFSSGLAVVGGCPANDRRYGYSDKGANISIGYLYAVAKDFSEGLAAVSTGKLFGYIDVTGTTVIPFRYDEAGQFSEGVAPVSLDGQHEYIDKHGAIQIPAHSYMEIQPFTEGLAAVKIKGKNKWGYIDHSGRLKIDADYDSASGFSDGLAAVETDEHFEYIDLAGQKVFANHNFEIAKQFSEGLAAVRDNHKWGYINLKGDFAISPRFEGAEQFNNSLALVVTTRIESKDQSIAKEAVTFSYIDMRGKSAAAQWTITRQHEGSRGGETVWQPSRYSFQVHSTSTCQSVFVAFQEDLRIHPGSANCSSSAECSSVPQIVSIAPPFDALILPGLFEGNYDWIAFCGGDRNTGYFSLHASQTPLTLNVRASKVN